MKQSLSSVNMEEQGGNPFQAKNLDNLYRHDSYEAQTTVTHRIVNGNPQTISQIKKLAAISIINDDGSYAPYTHQELQKRIDAKQTPGVVIKESKYVRRKDGSKTYKFVVAGKAQIPQYKALAYEEIDDDEELDDFNLRFAHLWSLSVKLDGWQAIWTGVRQGAPTYGRLETKRGAIYNVPEEIYKQFEAYFGSHAVQGELCVQENPTVNSQFRIRRQHVVQMTAASTSNIKPKDFLKQYFDQVKSRGGEGLMLTHNDSVVQHNGTANKQYKIKMFRFTKARIVSVEREQKRIFIRTDEIENDAASTVATMVNCENYIDIPASQRGGWKTEIVEKYVDAKERYEAGDFSAKTDLESKINIKFLGIQLEGSVYKLVHPVWIQESATAAAAAAAAAPAPQEPSQLDQAEADRVKKFLPPDNYPLQSTHTLVRQSGVGFRRFTDGKHYTEARYAQDCKQFSEDKVTERRNYNKIMATWNVLEFVAFGMPGQISGALPYMTQQLQLKTLMDKNRERYKMVRQAIVRKKQAEHQALLDSQTLKILKGRRKRFIKPEVEELDKQLEETHQKLRAAEGAEVKDELLRNLTEIRAKINKLETMGLNQFLIDPQPRGKRGDRQKAQMALLQHLNLGTSGGGGAASLKRKRIDKDPNPSDLQKPKLTSSFLDLAAP